jgi:hypothetical protein
VLHVKIAQLDKCRMSLSIVVSVTSSSTTFTSVASWSLVSQMMFRHTAMIDDTKEALITSHMTDLKEENWSIEVK